MITNLQTHPCPYVRVGELSRYLAVHRDTVRKWILSGRLEGIRPEGCRVVLVVTASARRLETCLKRYPGL